MDIEPRIEYKPRAYDGKIVAWQLMADPTQNIADEDWHGREMFFPMRWVAIGIYDAMLEAV
jgi:hypothetical protein